MKVCPEDGFGDDFVCWILREIETTSPHEPNPNRDESAVQRSTPMNPRGVERRNATAQLPGVPFSEVK